MAKKSFGAILVDIAKKLGIDVTSVKKNSRKALREENKELEKKNLELQKQVESLTADNKSLVEENNRIYEDLAEVSISEYDVTKENNELQSMLDSQIEARKVVEQEDGSLVVYNQNKNALAVVDGDEIDVRDTEYYNHTLKIITNYFDRPNISIGDYRNKIAESLYRSIENLNNKIADNKANADEKALNLESELDDKINSAKIALEEEGLNVDEYKDVFGVMSKRIQDEIKALRKATEKENAKYQEEIDACYEMAEITEDQLKEILILFGIKTYTKSFIKFINELKRQIRREGDQKLFLKYTFKDSIITESEMKAYLLGMINNEHVEYEITDDFKKKYDAKIKEFRYYTDLAKKCVQVAKLIGDEEFKEFAEEVQATYQPLLYVSVNEVKENLVRRALLKRLKEAYKVAQATKDSVSKKLKDMGEISTVVGKLSSRTIYNGSKIEGENLALKEISGSTETITD